jgi:hypothetical protein
MLCQSQSLVNRDDHICVAVTLRCRSWLCPECQPVRKRQLLELAVHGTPTKFVTLTANPAVGVSPADRARQLARAWRLVVGRAKRQFKIADLNYLAVFEATKRGEPHLHILLRSPFIPQRWLSDQMRAIMRSPIVDIRQVKNPRQAAHYVAKYIGKAPHRFATCKRYWHSKNWVTTEAARKLDIPRPTGQWVIDDRALWIIEQDWRADHLKVETIGQGMIRCTRDIYRTRAGPWHKL